MKEYLSSFGKTATRLSHNPLGILALFLVLVYGFACLVVGLGGKSLDGSSERLPLIWFLVIFPVLVLYVFYLLVTRHHRKLYAPSDYKDETLFIKPLKEEIVKHRVEEGISEVIASEQIPALESSFTANTSQSTTEQIKTSYLQAEKLAFMALQKDLGFNIRQQVSIMGSHYEYGFDGIAPAGKTLHFLEVKYFQKPVFKPEFIEAALHRVTSIALSPSVWDSDKYDDIIFHLVVVFAFPSEQLQDFERRLKNRIREELFEVQYHFYDLTILKERFEKCS